MANHLRHLREARAVSLLSDFEKVHIGCVLVYNNRVIAAGHNSNKSHTIQMKYNKYRSLRGHKIEHKIHAETMAMQKLAHFDIDYRKVVCYNYREGKDGRPMLSRPCPSCMRMLQDLGIRKVIYSTETEVGWCEERIA